MISLVPTNGSGRLISISEAPIGRKFKSSSRYFILIMEMGFRLTVIGLVFNIIGSLFLAKPLIKSKELIKEITTYEDSGAILGMGTVQKRNPSLIKSLQRDNIFGIVGIILLVIGFLSQLISLLY
ncbi:MAG: hypothetical protein AABX32_02925 [Nanoarchaeota archaeon]